jgi:hypothetical protein
VGGIHNCKRECASSAFHPSGGKPCAERPVAGQTDCATSQRLSDFAQTYRRAIPLSFPAILALIVASPNQRRRYERRHQLHSGFE